MATRVKNDYKSEVVLGKKYRDIVTGYEGTATAIVFFLNGCERVTLERWVESEASLKELTFDAPRLKDVETQKQVRVARTGGVRNQPGRPATPTR